MQYSTHIVCTLLPMVLRKSTVDRIVATAGASLEQKIDDIAQGLAQTLQQLQEQFGSRPVDPERTFDFEHQVDDAVREVARQFVQAVYNHAEPAIDVLPKHVHFEASQYTRLNRKTPQNTSTLFGQIRLHRAGYRPTDKSGDATIFRWPWPWG